MAGDRGSTVVKVLRYKSEGRWFDPRWCRGIFHWQKSFWSHYGPGVDSASNRNEYQEYFLGLNAAGA
jgi:spore maturation protein CgeB